MSPTRRPCWQLAFALGAVFFLCFRSFAVSALQADRFQCRHVTLNSESPPSTEQRRSLERALLPCFASATNSEIATASATSTVGAAVRIPIHQSSLDSDPAAAASSTPPIFLIGKALQVRHPSFTRKPKHYWSDLANMARELSYFWDDCASTAGLERRGTATALKSSSPPPIRRKLVIPNETLLRFYNRHDLRGAIAAHGGRRVLAEKLREAFAAPTSSRVMDVTILSGRWADAMNESSELRAIVLAHPQLSVHRPPSICEHSARWGHHLRPRWSHQSHRRPKGYWSNQTAVLLELYEYVDQYQREHGRPSAWMPRGSELRRNGRSDLAEALVRFGGADVLGQMAGMVPYREWQYFEGQLELVLDLRRYCDMYQRSDYTRFPCVSHMRERGYNRLHALVQFYGGRKFLAQRLGMSYASSRRNRANDDDNNDTVATTTSFTSSSVHQGMSWGQFDLDFAVRLLLWVRRDQLLRSPPVTPRAVAIPSSRRLLLLVGRHGSSERLSASEKEDMEEGAWLHAKINEYGGYENVARRLGLAFGSVPVKQ